MRHTRSILAGVILLLCNLTLSYAAFADLPSVKLVTAPMVTPSSAIQYYNALPTTHTQGVAAWTTRPPEIQELARSLGAGQYSAAGYANNVYEYVRNNIATEFRFGLSKGARGALIDQSGTTFDQAHLMVELLRQGAIIGNYTTAVNYAVGTLSLTGAQFQAWTGISDAAAACQFLADGGVPVAVNSPTATTCPTTPNTAITSVTMLHIWVTANGVLYDPSYKIVIKKSGIDLATAMQCKPSGVTTCGTSLLTPTLVPATTQTCGIAGVNCVTNVNQTGIETQLTTYAHNLQSYIQNYNTTNGTYLALEDVVGGLIIDTSQTPTTGSLLPSAAYGSATYTWSGDIPDPFRTTLTVQFDQINQLLFADEIAGNRLRIFGYAATGTGSTTDNYTLYSEYRPIAASSLANQTGGVNTVQLSIHHPYAANSGAYAAETISNQVVELLNECAFGTYGCSPTAWHVGVITIVHGFGEQTASTMTHYADLQRRDKVNGMPVEDPTSPNQIYLHNTNLSKTNGYCIAGSGVPSLSNPWNTCYGEEHGTIVAQWLAETSRTRTIAGAVNSAVVQNHHSLGIAFSDAFITGGETNLSLQTMMSFNSTSAVGADRTAAFMSVAASMNRLEGGVFEQENGAFDGGAAVSAMVLSNKNHVPFLDVNSTNMSAVATYFANNSGSNWPAPFVSAMTSYVSATPEAYQLIVPLNGFAGSFALPSTTLNYSGTGIAAFGVNNDHVAYLATLGAYLSLIPGPNLLLKGSGGPPTDDPLAQAEQSVKVSDYAGKSRKMFGVDLNSGELKLTPAPDLVTGTGDFPYSLSYQRVYSASLSGVTDTPVFFGTLDHYLYPTEPDPAAIGGGWTHTLAIKAQIDSDALSGMGRDSGLAASSIISGMFVQRWLGLGTVDIRSRLANIFATHWMMNSLNQNVVVVTRPPSRQTFAKLPDNTFDPGAGNAEKLTQNGAQTLSGFNGGWVWNAVGVTLNLLAKDGSTMSFQQFLPSGGPAGVAYPLPSTYLFVPTTWSFPSGVLLTFAYQTSGWMAAWNQACLTGVSNNLGRALTFNDPCVGQPGIAGGAQWVKDDAGRQVSFYDTAGLPSRGSFLSQALENDLFVVGADGGTTHYSYAPTLPPLVDRPYYGVAQWYTPDDANNPYVTVSYDSLFRVSSIADNSLPTHFTTQYFIAGLYGTQNQKRSETIDPLGALTTSYFDFWGNNLQTIDPLGWITSHAYDTNRRVAKTVLPDQNADSFLYDVRSNLLTTTHIPKPGSTLLSTKEMSSYEEGPTVFSCASPATCNRQASTTDADNNVTTYTYLSTGTGQLQRIVGPALTAQTGGVSGNAQEDLCYANLIGSSGTISLLAATINRVDAVTNRVKGVYYNTLANHFVLQASTIDPATTYIPPAAAGGPCTQSTKSGALALTTTFTFDNGATGPGNVTMIDGPVAGTSDVTNYTFDAKRRLTSTAVPSVGAYTRYCYDPDGQLVSTNRARTSGSSDPYAATESTNGQCAAPNQFSSSSWLSETKSYFPTGDLFQVADAANHITQYAYDPTGRRQVVQDPDGRQTATVYDLAGRVLAEWRGGSGWINTNNQPSGTWPSTWNPSNYVGTGPYQYESYCNGLPQSQSQNCYTPNGKPIYAVDANGNITRYQYDGMDRLQFTYFPDPSSGSSLCAVAVNDGALPTCSGNQTYEQYGYDNFGNQTSRRTRKGDTIGFGFDAMNRQATRSPAGQGAVTIGLNLVGEPLLISKAAYGTYPAHTTGRTYDADGRKLSESNDALTVSYQYDTLNTLDDNAGSRTRTIWPDTYYASYGYDGIKRMTEVRENSTTTNELAYYVYDVLSRRQLLCLGAGSGGGCQAGTWANSVGYSYELDSELNGLAHTLNGTSVNLGYSRNNSYQITGVTANDPFYLPTPPVSLTTYAPNALNAYASISGQVSTYDLNGNTLTWYPLTGKHTYTYDSENRLTTAAVGGSTTPTISYDYDGLGRRVSKTVSGVVTSYLLDGDEEIAEYTGTALLRRYVTGPGVDDRVAHVEGNTLTNPPKTYYHTNHQGSVIAVTDASGNVTQRMSYDEYGNLSAGSAATGEQFRYTGRRYDPETGLYYYRARYYSPVLGRFLQTDPIGYKDNLDLYTYTGNDPLDRTDPSGKQIAEGALVAGCVAQPEICAVVAVAAVLGAGAVAEHVVNNAEAPPPPDKPPASGPAPQPAAAAPPPPEGDPEDPNRSRDRTEHGQQRANEAQSDPNRQVGDANRVVREGRTYLDNDSGNTVHVNGDRVVITDQNGKIVTQFTNSRANTLERVQSGRWTPTN